MSQEELNNKAMKNLFEAVAAIETPAEAKNFLRDLCTLSELTSMAERLQVAKLIENETSYRNIAKRTGASTTTVTRVAHWVHHGMGGYGLILGRLKA